MFLFNGSTPATKVDSHSIFDIDELRQIVLAFPPPKRAHKQRSQEISSPSESRGLGDVHEWENGSSELKESQVEGEIREESLSRDDAQEVLDIDTTPMQTASQGSNLNLEHSKDADGEKPSNGLATPTERETANRLDQDRGGQSRRDLEAFIQCWSRLEAKEIQLYLEGLESLVGQPLEQDCKNVLLSHLIQLIPRLIKSATKDASRDGQFTLPRSVAAKVQSFQEQLKSAQDLDILLKALNKFDRFLKTSNSLMGAMHEAKAARLQELCHQMEHDPDGPRLFLGLVVIMWSTSRGNQGLIYITGKLSPRLLKLLAARADKGELSEDEANRVRLAAALKDKVKDGALTNLDIQWMRWAAEDAVNNWKQRPGPHVDETTVPATDIEASSRVVSDSHEESQPVLDDEERELTKTVRT